MTEDEIRKDVIARCEKLGEDAVRGHVQTRSYFSQWEFAYAATWLSERDSERNAAATRKSLFWARFSTIAAGIAALAALFTAIVTSCSGK